MPKRSHRADIEQPLTGRNLIKSANLFAKQAQDFELHLVEALDEVVALVLYRYTNAVHPV